MEKGARAASSPASPSPRAESKTPSSYEVGEVDSELFVRLGDGRARAADVFQPDLERRAVVELEEDPAVRSRDRVRRSDRTRAVTRGDADRLSGEEPREDDVLVTELSADEHRRAVERELVAREAAGELRARRRLCVRLR